MAIECVPMCGHYVSWWNGEWEAWCYLPEDHDPPDVHSDGGTWWGWDGYEVDEPRTTQSN
jgi:hypothetical protein